MENRLCTGARRTHGGFRQRVHQFNVRPAQLYEITSRLLKLWYRLHAHSTTELPSGKATIFSSQVLVVTGSQNCSAAKELFPGRVSIIPRYPSKTELSCCRLSRKSASPLSRSPHFARGKEQNWLVLRLRSRLKHWISLCQRWKRSSWQ